MQAATAPTAYCMLALQCKQLPLLLLIACMPSSTASTACFYCSADANMLATDTDTDTFRKAAVKAPGTAWERLGAHGSVWERLGMPGTA